MPLAKDETPRQPEAPKDMPTIPPWLNAAARKYFNDYCNDLKDAGVISKIDGESIAQTAAQTVLVIKLRKAANTVPLIDGDGKVTPIVSEIRQQQAQLRAWMSEIGITLKGRSGMRLAKVTEDVIPTPMASILKGSQDRN